MRTRNMVGVVTSFILVACGAGGGDEPTWKAGSPQEVSAAQAQVTAEVSEAPTLPDPGLDIRQWANWMSVCGTGANGGFDFTSAPAHDPEDVMKAMPPEMRAKAIFDFVMTEALSSFEVAGLVHLIGYTKDQKAISYISTIFDAARELAERNVRVNLGADPASRSLFVSNMTTANRVASVNAAGHAPGPEADAFLQRVIGGDDESAASAATEILNAQ